MAKEAEWNNRFNIGVDSIDNAHRKLFSIVRKLINLSRNENNGKWACAEGIKYFKSYAIEHFTDEENYMKSISYQGYEQHKSLHDDMRYKTIPALEKDLTRSGYSQESIHHFLGICLGWLTAHIMIEDRAITGKAANRRQKNGAGKNLSALEDALAETIEEIFRLQPEIVSEHYSGDDFGNSVFDRLTYQTADGKLKQIFLVLEEGLALKAVSSMLNMELSKMDKLVRNAAKELSLQITEKVFIHMHRSSMYRLEDNHLITEEQFRKEFGSQCFDYSLLLNTGTGYFAFCVKTV